MLVICLIALAGCETDYGADPGNETRDPDDSLTAIRAQLTEGLTLYTAQCAGCHGDKGQGGSFQAITNCTNCSDLATLTAYNEANMPLPTPNNTLEQSTAISAYMLAGYLDESEIATYEPPATDSSISTSTNTSANTGTSPTAHMALNNHDPVIYGSGSFSFSGAASASNTGIADYQWFVDGILNMSGSQTYNHTVSVVPSASVVTLVVTDQDSQTDSTSMRIYTVDNDMPTLDPDGCDTPLSFYAKTLQNFYETCATCHRIDGNRTTQIATEDDDSHYFLSMNLQTISSMLASPTTRTQLFEKPQGIAHGGGQISGFGPSSSDYRNLETLEDLINNGLPSSCL